MRLIIKTTLLYLLLALPVFAIGGIITYHMVKKEVEKETDYYLRETCERLEQAIAEGKPLDALNNEKVQIRVLPEQHWEESKTYSDTLGKHPFLERLEPYRKLTAISPIGDEFYQVTLIDVLIESDDMYEGVVSIISRLFLTLCLAMIVFSFLISKWLFWPFQQTLESLRSFNLKSDTPLALPATSTREFRNLNNLVQKMAVKARSDYRSLKEFTENASHEMQTPIAIANGRLELLLESEEFSEKQLSLVQSAHQAIHRLSKIGKSLTLLTRIDNQEFSSLQKTDLCRAVNAILDQYDELAGLQGIRIERKLQPKVEKQIDPALAEVLIANLVKNAIQHNEQNGRIEVMLTDTSLRITNTGKPPGAPTYQLFDRFRKGNQSESSLGLGLAIVKKICDVCEWQVQYNYEEGIHSLTVEFGMK